MEEIKYDCKKRHSLAEDYYNETAWQNWISEDNYD